jgi:carboxypeptidase Taq
MNKTVNDLKARLAEIHDLQTAKQLLGWDQETMMPPLGAGVRAEQLATLELFSHEKLASDEIGRLLEELREFEAGWEYDSDEASLIRVARRDHEKARRVPKELMADMWRESALAIEVWKEARRTSDFELMLPALQKNIDLKHRYVECFGDAEDPYDVLLDDYEEGMKTAEVRVVLERLKDELGPFIAAIADEQVEDSFLYASYPIARQREFALTVIERFGFRSDSWRLDESAHPFASGSSSQDIRLTTRWDENEVKGGLFACMHECGHGLYEHGIGPSLERTPLGEGVSMGLHESQSRMWENLVGRSRPFWRWAYPQMQRAFPEQLGGVEEEAFYRAVNRVRPSLIRVEADEVTYNMHIILRFELEQEILGGRLSLRELPEAWNARMEEYLGVRVPSAAEGVLQDIHWPGGSLGYFPTYSLGNVISVQIWERAREALPDLDDQFEAGEFGDLREWLGENLYRHGRKFTPKETVERVAGGPIDPEPYVRYLKGKLGEIYGAAVTA